MNKIVQRFWSKVVKGSSDECWEWIGGFFKSGYGCFWNGERMVRAHRFSYELQRGESGDLFVCHSCDNPKCVNPNHLFLGTHQENMRDMVSKKCSASGVQVAQSKLTEEQVKEILVSEESGGRLAKKFGVSRTHISSIRRGRYWVHVQ